MSTQNLGLGRMNLVLRFSSKSWRCQCFSHQRRKDTLHHQPTHLNEKRNISQWFDRDCEKKISVTPTVTPCELRTGPFDLDWKKEKWEFDLKNIWNMNKQLLFPWEWNWGRNIWGCVPSLEERNKKSKREKLKKEYIHICVEIKLQQK